MHDTLTRSRLHTGAQHLRTLGPGAVAAFIEDLAARIGGLPAAVGLLAEYSTRTRPRKPMPRHTSSRDAATRGGSDDARNRRGLPSRDLRRYPRSWRGRCPAATTPGTPSRFEPAEMAGTTVLRQRLRVRTSWPRRLLGRPVNRHLLARLIPMPTRDDGSAIGSGRWPSGEDRNLPTGTLADRYLTGRGLPGLAASAALRFRGDTPHPEGGRLPAMIALVSDVAGQAGGASIAPSSPATERRRASNLRRHRSGQSGVAPSGCIRSPPTHRWSLAKASKQRHCGPPDGLARLGGYQRRQSGKGLVLPPEARQRGDRGGPGRSGPRRGTRTRGCGGRRRTKCPDRHAGRAWRLQRPADGARGSPWLTAPALPCLTLRPTAPWGDPDMTVMRLNRRPPPPLPLDVFGSAWEQWIVTTAEAAGCPPDYVAMPLLASASALIGNARWAQATPAWAEPPHLWACVRR